jgi:sigma-B regulation protein RsbU (phosphoserine phosphatase)
VVETLQKTGIAIGVVTDYRFNLLETRFHPGDMLFAFTDGALDSQNPAGEQFGRERLMAVSQQNGGSAHELVELIQSELRNYGSGETQFDDITLLAVRRC